MNRSCMYTLVSPDKLYLNGHLVLTKEYRLYNENTDLYTYMYSIFMFRFKLKQHFTCFYLKFLSVTYTVRQRNAFKNLQILFL